MIKIEVDGKILFKEYKKLFSIHYIPNQGDTFEIRLKDEEPVLFEVIKKHFIFKQVPSYEGNYNQDVVLKCKKIKKI